MKILYDDQIFSVQKIGGISRYFYELIKRNKKSKLSLLYTENFYLKKQNTNFNFKGKVKVIEFFNRLNSIKDLLRNKYDLFHPTYYDEYFLKYNKKPFVITIHDMIYEIYQGKYFSKYDKIIAQKKKLCEKANGIIAISEKTKEDLIEILKINPEKIRVIYHGSNLIKENVRLEFPKRYILFVGSRDGYKNFDMFLKYIAIILKKDKTLFLVCIGKAFSKEETTKIKNLNIDNKVIQKMAKDNEMYSIYKNAECFVFPSLYEGFGIPILEAYESECPVVLSNCSCFPEIAQNAAEFFDVDKPMTLIQAIENIIYDPKRKYELIELGKERFKMFSWEKTYKQTMEYYSEVLLKYKA